MSIEVSSPGLIKLRIAKSNNNDVSSMKNYKNVIEFNVSNGYVVDTYSCTSGDYTYDNINDTLTISNMKEDTYCTINYKTGYKKLYDIIMGQPLVSNNGLKETETTNSRTSVFYYKGQVENNYIQLEEKEGSTLYRIVRTNEDKSIRLIRQSSIGSYYFSPLYDNYKYMYYSETNVERESDNYPGAIKRLNNWYKENIETAPLASHIVESTFCEQAKVKPVSSYTSGSATMEVTDNYYPNLRCTLDGNEKGPLNMNVGLLTIDEILLAGLKYNENSNNYLVNNDNWWSISPAGARYYTTNQLSAYAWYIGPKGAIYPDRLFGTIGLRPVLSLSSSITVAGKGTKEEPFRPIL